jgi:surface antigen
MRIDTAPVFETPTFREQVLQITHDMRLAVGRIAATGLLLLGGGAVGFAGQETIDPHAAHAEVAGYPWADADHVPMPPASDNLTWGYTNKSTCDDKSGAYDCNGYKEGNYYVYDTWKYYLRNCTSYVAWRIANEYGADASGLGNASNWDDGASAKGWSVKSTPEAGDIAQWDTAAGGLGHVAFVESVNADGSVNVSDYNSGLDGAYKGPSERKNLRAEHYIDVNGANTLDSPMTSNPSNTVRRVIHTTDTGTNLVFWAKQDTVFETAWRPGSAPQLAQVAHGPDIADIEVQLRPDHQRLIYTANKDGTVTESWYYPGQAIHTGTIIRDGGRIKDIEKSVGPSGEQQLYVMTPEGVDEYWWYPGGAIHKNRLYTLRDPVAMKKTPLEPDGTQILYVADRSHVYENAWKPGLGLSTGGEVLFIPQADITDMDVTIDADGKHRAYVGRERDGIWEGAWYRGWPVTTRQLAGGNGIRDIEAHQEGNIHQLYAATEGGVFEYWWEGEGPTTGSLLTQQADIHAIDRSRTVDGLPAVYTGAGSGVVESWWGSGGAVKTGVIA